MRRHLALVAAAIAIAGQLRADVPPTESLRYFLPDDDIRFDERVPDPEAFFGFAIGDWHLTHHELLAYYRALAAAAPRRVLLEEVGKTAGRRTQILLTIASSKNRQKLESIRTANVANALGQHAAPDSAPAVIWLGYSIHGNEPSGANAAPIVAYYLAAGRGPAIDDILEHTVVLIDPYLNPDGLDRFANWSNNHRGEVPNTDPADREHREDWPSGRTNYYWHDLNRDWLPAVMPASQNHLAIFHRWKPAVFCDFHEMSGKESYFFQPGVPTMVNPDTAPGNQALTQKLARYHADALDAIGSLYFTGERYDDFYIGKGSTYPDLLGSVGILFEQASARGHSQQTPNGLLTLRFAVRNHVRTSLSSLRGTCDLHRALLDHQFTAATTAVTEAEHSSIRAYAFSAPGDPERVRRFATWLARHDIRFQVLKQELEASDTTFPRQHTVIVPTAQPAYRLITAMFEKRTAFQTHAFYDVSAWNMAEAYGLTWCPLDHAPTADTVSEDGILPAISVPQISASRTAIALAFEWSPLNAPRTAYRFLDEGARIRVAMAPFKTQTAEGEVAFHAGAIVIVFGIQDVDRSKLLSLAEQATREDHIAIHAIESGFTPEGIDIGSRSMRTLPKPTIALATGSGSNVYHAGEVWHLLDHDLGIPLTLLDREDMTQQNLSRFSVLVFSDGKFDPREAIKQWVESGGTLIVTGQAARTFADAKWVPLEEVSPDFGDAQGPFDEARETAAVRRIAGSIVEARMDLSHPIAFGYTSEKIALMRDRTFFLAPAKSPYATPVRYAKSPLISGYIAEPNLKALAQSAAVEVQHLGSGQVIAFADAPAFRSHWIGSSKLLLNAIFFGSMMKAEGGRADD